MRTLNYNMRGAGRRIWQRTLNLRGGDGMVGMDGTENRGELGRKIFEGYPGKLNKIFSDLKKDDSYKKLVKKISNKSVYLDI